MNPFDSHFSQDEGHSFLELFSQNIIQKRINDLGKEIADYYQKLGDISYANPLIAVSILKGSILFFSDLVRAMKLPLKMDFIEVSSYDDSTVSTGIVKLMKDFTENIQDKHILIIDDIIDTGLTINYLFENFQTRHPKSIEIAALLSKDSKSKLNIPVRFKGFEIEDQYVVGYGMDYQGLYRNKPNISILTIG